MDPVTAPFDVLAVDGLAVIGTLGFFGPAAILLTMVVVAVVRDRRLAAEEEAEEAAQQARVRESLDDHDDVRGRRPAEDRPRTPRAD